MWPLLGDGDGVAFPQQCRKVFLDGVPWHAGERDAALACGLAARQPNRERLRDGLRILLEGLEERPDLVEEDSPRRQLCL
jgi:hypothetical protein